MKKIYKLSILLLLIILIMGICIFAIRVYKTNNNKNVIEIDGGNKNNSNLDVKNETNVSYVVLEIEDVEAEEKNQQGIETKKIKVTDKQKINALMSIINDSTIYKEDGFIADFGDVSPSAIIYMENGDKFTISTGDGIDDNGEIVNLMTRYKNDDESNKTIYKVNEKLGEYIEKLAKENNIQENKYSKNIILFKGMEISNKIGLQDVTDMRKNSEKDYNTKYYNYENGKYLNESNGLKEDTYERQFIISNVKKIAMTKKYNAIPREFKTIKSIPNELIDMLDYSSVEINEIDLDGDNKKEHIICYTFETSNDDYEDGEMQALSGIMLMDENYKKIADLVTLDNGFWGNIKSEENKIFLSLKDVEYIDLDEDGIMEIIIEIPTYEGTKISVLKYEKGVLSGEKDVKASVIP